MEFRCLIPLGPRPDWWFFPRREWGVFGKNG